MAGSPARAAYLRPVGHFAVSAIGRDRPGIVAALAAGLLDLSGNIEDSRMTILGGHFSVMLIVTVPSAASAAEVEAALEPARDTLSLDAITVSRLDAIAERAVADHVITVYGSDHPGIVHAISSELAEAGVDITDLQTRLAGSEPSPLYVMMLEIALGAANRGTLEARLSEVASSAAVEVELHPLDAEAL